MSQNKIFDHAGVKWSEKLRLKEQILQNDLAKVGGLVSDQTTVNWTKKNKEP